MNTIGFILFADIFISNKKEVETIRFYNLKTLMESKGSIVNPYF